MRGSTPEYLHYAVLAKVFTEKNEQIKETPIQKGKGGVIGEKKDNKKKRVKKKG